MVTNMVLKLNQGPNKSIFIFLFVIFCWKSVGIFNVQFPENVIVKCCFSELWTIRKMLKLWRQYTVSVHSLNTQSQYTLSVHSLSTQSQYTVSVHSVSTQYKVNTEHVWNERSTDLKVHWIVVNFAKNLFTYKVKKICGFGWSLNEEWSTSMCDKSMKCNLGCDTFIRWAPGCQSVASCQVQDLRWAVVTTGKNVCQKFLRDLFPLQITKSFHRILALYSHLCPSVCRHKRDIP